MKIILLLFALSTHCFALDECSNHLNDCEYYSCISSQKNCDSSSYLTKFGKKYCNKFQKNKKKFSEKGQRWLEEVKNCLIRQIDDVSQVNSCSDFKELAMSHHVPCYVNSGYCQLSKNDKKQIRKTIMYSMWRPLMIKAGLQVLSRCRKLGY